MVERSERNTPPGMSPLGPDVAPPAKPSTYVIPGSHLLDAPYRAQLNPDWPYPRQPRAYESESRAPGTGMIHGGG